MSQWLKIDLRCPQNIVSQLHFAKTDPCSSRTVSLRQLSFLFLPRSDQTFICCWHVRFR